MEFKKRGGEKIPDVVQYIKDYLAHEPGTFDIAIGCDSKPPKGFHIEFYNVIVLHRTIDGVGRGGHAIYRKIRTTSFLGTRKLQIMNRLWKEIEISIETAKELEKAGVFDSEKLNSFKINIHIDCNTDNKFDSNPVYESAVGYVKSYGYECNAKPYAWAASYVADALTRGDF